MKTLVVDDEPVTLRTMIAALEGPDTELRIAEDGQQAWEILQRESIPIVVTDWAMPKMGRAGARPSHSWRQLSRLHVRDRADRS